jgi:adenine-specific DNA methylase
VKDFDIVVAENREFEIFLPIKARNVDRLVFFDLPVVFYPANYHNVLFLHKWLAQVKEPSLWHTFLKG